MPATFPRTLPATSRYPGSPADLALSKIISLLHPAGYEFTIPGWDGDAYLKINNALQAITDLTIASHGNLTWSYRSTQCPHLHPSRLISMAIELLDPDRTRRQPALPQLDGYPLAEVIRYALYLYGFTATITEPETETGARPALTATNPNRPHRGTLEITDDGKLTWHARAPHHPDGGIPLPDIATTIARALAFQAKGQA